MRSIVGRLVMLTAALPPLAGPVLAGEAKPTELAATFNNSANTYRYKHLVCIYSQGSVVHQCELTETGPQATEGMACYCGNSPKGRIKSVPLLLAPP